MKKIRTVSILMMLLLAAFFLKAQPVITVADGDFTDSHLPMMGIGNPQSPIISGLINQMIYPEDSLKALLNAPIVKIVFYATGSVSYGVSGTIKLMQTSTTTLAELENTSSATEVYHGAIDIGENGLLEFEFDAPFTYTGGNLLIELATTEPSTVTGVSFYGIETLEDVSFSDYVVNAHAMMILPVNLPSKFLPKITFYLTAHTTHTIIATADENGTISPDGIVAVTEGRDQTFTMIPNAGYEIDEVLVDSVNNLEAVANGSYTFENVTEDHTISVSFKQKNYTIIATAGENGTISPDGIVTVIGGEDQIFMITPDEGYVIDEVLVDSVNNLEAVANGSYTFENVTEDHTILVTFKIDIGIKDHSIQNVKVYAYMNTIHVENEYHIPLKSIEIIDVMGKIVYSSKHVGNSVNLDVAKGTYTVRLVSESAVLNRKVVIR